MYRDDTGFLPRVLEQLKPYVGNGPGGDEFNETVDMFHDAWGNHFVFIADTGGGPARVISYGSDGVAGGTRHAKDIEVIVPEKDTEERHNKTD